MYYFDERCSRQSFFSRQSRRRLSDIYCRLPHHNFFRIYLFLLHFFCFKWHTNLNHRQAHKTCIYIQTCHKIPTAASYVWSTRLFFPCWGSHVWTDTVPAARQGISTFLSSSAKILVWSSAVTEGGSAGKCFETQCKTLEYCMQHILSIIYIITSQEAFKTSSIVK